VNKAAVAGIIAVIVIGIGVIIGITQPFTTTTTQAPAEISTESEEPEANEFKIVLEEKIGLEGKP
jgi:hypothetical protein